MRFFGDRFWQGLLANETKYTYVNSLPSITIIWCNNVYFFFYFSPLFVSPSSIFLHPHLLLSVWICRPIIALIKVLQSQCYINFIHFFYTYVDKNVQKSGFHSVEELPIISNKKIFTSQHGSKVTSKPIHKYSKAPRHNGREKIMVSKL